MPDILPKHVRSDFEAKRIGQGVFEDEFLFDRIVDALPPAKRAGGLEFERPVARLADIRPLKEAEQVFCVERIEGIAWRSRLRRAIVAGGRDGRREGDRERDAEAGQSAAAALGPNARHPPLLTTAV